MKTIEYNHTVKEILNDEKLQKECPLKLNIIPNYMGINLCCVEQLRWIRQDDNQLIHLEIHFNPNKEA